MVSSPIVSIVIPCYNDAHYIEESVLSAVNQTYENKEIIVVDDGSDERTKKVLKNLQPKIDALITQENKGLSAARNLGIKSSRGEFILVQDSDDFFDSTFCEKAVNAFNQDNNIKLVTCHAVRFYKDHKKNNLHIPIGGGLENFLKVNSAIGTSMFCKIDWKHVNGYDEEMREGYEDWEFFIRILSEGGKAFVLPEPLFYYRQKSNSMRIEANKKKYDLLRYIYIKHQNLYIKNYEILIDHLLTRVEREENEKIKHTKRLEFIIGTQILRPLRYIKSLTRL
jgi:glycosyltransferase involved in cell wall biosynthesis